MTSASFFCVVTALYFVLSPYFTRLCSVPTPRLLSRSHLTDKVAASAPIPCVIQLLGHAVQKGLSRVQISLFCIRDEQFGNRRGQNPTICTREDQWE